MTSGAIYIITQNPRYVGLLLSSARSLKNAMPQLPITVFSEFEIPPTELFENITRVKGSADGFYDKTLFMQQSPYERTLFIDADTYVVDPISELFLLLDRFDCAATHEEYSNTDWSNCYPLPEVPESFPEFNTGILAFGRNQRVEVLFKEWAGLYQEFSKKFPAQRINDQPFFRRAAYRSEARIATLTREYNCKFRGQGYLNGRVKILHGHVDLKLEDRFVQRAESVLNKSVKPRVYIAGKVYEQDLVGRILDRRKARKVGQFPLLSEPVIMAGARKLRQIVRTAGLGKTLLKAIGLTRKSRNA